MASDITFKSTKILLFYFILKLKIKIIDKIDFKIANLAFNNNMFLILKFLLKASKTSIL